MYTHIHVYNKQYTQTHTITQVAASVQSQSSCLLPELKRSIYR